MAWHCYNCGKNNEDEDLKCTNCFKSKNVIQVKSNNFENMSKSEKLVKDNENVDDTSIEEIKNNKVSFKPENSNEVVEEEIDYTRNNYCRNCGYKFEEQVKQCPKCGVNIIDKRIENVKVSFLSILLIIVSIVSLVMGTLFFNFALKLPMVLLSFTLITNAYLKYRHNATVTLLYVIEVVYTIIMFIVPYTFLMFLMWMCNR